VAYAFGSDQARNGGDLFYVHARFASPAARPRRQHRRAHPARGRVAPLRALLARPAVVASGVVPRLQVNLLKDPDTLLLLQGGQRAYVEVS
jgi:hypothetical protein